jgi:uncharacterized protein
VKLGALVLLLCAVACRKDDAKPAPPQVAPVASGADPWATPVDPDAPPTGGERRKLAEEACPKVTKPFFWAIEKNHRTSYVLGTLAHGVLLAKLPPAVVEHVRGARVVVFESLPEDPDRFAPPDIDLRRELGPELWERWARLVGQSFARSHEHTRPSIAILALYALYADLSVSTDEQLAHEASVAHVPARGLETFRTRGELADKLFDLRMLRAFVTQLARSDIEQLVRREVHEYCAGTSTTIGFDAETQAQLRRAGYTSAELDAMDDELTYKRTAAWISGLAELLDEGNVFVAVNVNHTVGPKGLPALLAKRGYKVTRLE